MPCATRVQAMSLTPDREGQEGNTLARLPSPLPHTATIRTPLPISRPGAYAGAYAKPYYNASRSYVAHYRSRGTRKGIHLRAQTAAPPEGGRRCEDPYRAADRL